MNVHHKLIEDAVSMCDICATSKNKHTLTNTSEFVVFYDKEDEEAEKTAKWIESMGFQMWPSQMCDVDNNDGGNAKLVCRIYANYKASISSGIVYVGNCLPNSFKNDMFSFVGMKGRAACRIPADPNNQLSKKIINRVIERVRDDMQENNNS